MIKVILDIWWSFEDGILMCYVPRYFEIALFMKKNTRNVKLSVERNDYLISLLITIYLFESKFINTNRD